MQLFVNDLTVIDFSYCCKERGIVGESWIVDVLLDGELNEMSMVLDFGIVKKQIKAIIDDAVDHKLLVPTQTDFAHFEPSSDNEGHEYLDFISERASYFLQSPSCAFAKIDSDSINIDSVTSHLIDIIMQELPGNVKGLEIVLRPEQIDGFYYHYTHGLKLHDGNCQRIAHGHRSKIQLFLNDIRNISLEKSWCERWEDIYIASEDDEVAFEQAQLSSRAKQSLDASFKCYAYTAPQGRFDIAVEIKVLEVVDCDSTVELLADFVARQLKQEYSNDAIKVIGYEGVAKGAIAYA